jgi:periplasmic protein TonB
MNAETILRSDVLDIVFENRNKLYGAYPLRKEYEKRLLIAMATITTAVLLFCIADYFQHKRNDNTNLMGTVFQGPDSVIVSKVTIPEKPRIIKPVLPVAVIKNPVPIIVPDKEVKEPIHTVDEMDGKAIGDKDIAGLATTDDNQVAPDTHSAVSSTETAPAPEPEVVDIAEIMPEFPGGMQALLRFLGKNLEVPENALEPGEKVRVPVKFVVSKEGSLSGIEFPFQANDIFKKEIIRVLSKMPKWKPGVQNGRAVSVYYTIPVIFDMTEN